MSPLSTVAIALSLAACSTTTMQPRVPAKDAASQAQVGVVEASFDSDETEIARPSAKKMPMQAPRSGDLQREIAEFWADPTFQRNVARSYMRGAEVEPPITKREAELRTEALGLISRGETENAISRLSGRQGEDVSAEIDFLLGQLYFSEGRWDDAIREYERATNKYPKFRRAWKYLAFARMRKEEYRAASVAFVQVIQLGGVDAETYGSLALMHREAGDPVAAEAAFRMAAMLQPMAVKWRVSLAQALVQQGRFGEAANLTASLIKDNPEDAKLWLYQAEAFVGMQDTARAAQNLEIVDSLGASTYGTLTKLGRIYYNDGLFDLTADAYVRALALDEHGTFKAVFDIAQRLAMRSALDASSRLAMAIEKTFASEIGNDDKAELLRLRARLAGEAGQSAEQVALLEQIVEENPLDGAALIQLGRYYADHDAPEKAIFRFEQAAEREGFTAEAKMCHAYLLTNRGQFAEAVPLLRASLAAKPRADVQKLLDYAEREAKRSK